MLAMVRCDQTSGVQLSCRQISLTQESWLRSSYTSVQARVDITPNMPLTGNEKTLFERARKYIASGRLPRTVPASLGAGSGTGASCSLCGETIGSGQIEYEFAGAEGVTFRFHMRCHAIWQLAVDDLTNAGE